MSNKNPITEIQYNEICDVATKLKEMSFVADQILVSSIIDKPYSEANAESLLDDLLWYISSYLLRMSDSTPKTNSLEVVRLLLNNELVSPSIETLDTDSEINVNDGLIYLILEMLYERGLIDKHINISDYWVTDFGGQCLRILNVWHDTRYTEGSSFCQVTANNKANYCLHSRLRS